MRRAARRDSTEKAIAEALRKAGCTIMFLDESGAGDLLVGRAGVNWLFEVKRPVGPRGGQSADGQHLSERQQRWHDQWRGQVAVVRSVEEALRIVGALA